MLPRSVARWFGAGSPWHAYRVEPLSTERGPEAHLDSVKLTMRPGLRPLPAVHAVRRSQGARGDRHAHRGHSSRLLYALFRFPSRRGGFSHLLHSDEQVAQGWVAYHSQFISGDRAAWIGKFPVAASISWFEYLSFGGTASFVLFIGTAAALVAMVGWRRLVAFNSTISACSLLCLLTLTAAVAISLHTPIVTSRSMIVILPALYLIAGQLTSCLVRRWGKVAGITYLAAQVGLMGQPLLAYYTTEINEQWRDSAALVLHTPGCKSGTIHVYGDALNYGFFTKWVAPDLRLIDIPAAADLGNEPITSCPIMLWVVGVPEWDLGDLLVKLGLSRSSLEVVEYHEAFVILRKQP